MFCFPTGFSEPEIEGWMLWAAWMGMGEGTVVVWRRKYESPGRGGTDSCICLFLNSPILSNGGRGTGGRGSRRETPSSVHSFSFGLQGRETKPT